MAISSILLATPIEDTLPLFFTLLRLSRLLLSFPKSALLENLLCLRLCEDVLLWQNFWSESFLDDSTLAFLEFQGVGRAH